MGKRTTRQIARYGGHAQERVDLWQPPVRRAPKQATTPKAPRLPPLPREATKILRRLWSAYLSDARGLPRTSDQATDSDLALFLSDAAERAVGTVKPKAPARAARVPDVRFDFHLVGHGYQLDVFHDGVEYGGGCRDFDDSYNIERMKVSLTGALLAQVDRWQRTPVKGTPGEQPGKDK